MKKPMTILLMLSLFAIVGAFYAFKSDGIETPDYHVIKKFGAIEIRTYPKMLVAQTSLAESAKDQRMNNGFRTIAGYIFGGNERNQKIAMTAPVVMKMGDSASMYFMMPKKYSISELPQPNSKQVQLQEEASKTLAVIRFGGYSSEKKIAEYCEKLAAALAKNNIQSKGAFLYMGYNAPWDVINRRNEVAIEVININE